MKADLKRLIKNLKSRARYFEKKSGLTIEIPKIKTKKELEKESNRLYAKQVKFYKSTNKTVLKTIQTKHKKKDSKKREQSSISKVKKFTKSPEFAEFRESVKQYNKNLRPLMHSLKINITPTNQNELDRGIEALVQLRKGNINKARKILNVPENETLYKWSVRTDREISKRFGIETFNQKTFLETALREAKKSALPEIQTLFLDGGINLLEELNDAGFTFLEWLYGEDAGNPAGAIVRKLSAVRNYVGKKSANLITKFLDKLKK